MSEDFKAMKIVVRCSNWLGDVLMNTPALRALRGEFPSAHIAAIARRAGVEVLSSSGLVDEVFPVERGRWERIRWLRREKFHTGILLTNSFSSALDFWLGGVAQRVGYARDGRTSLLTHRLRAEESNLHRVDYFGKIVEALGARLAGVEYEFRIKEEGRQAAEDFLRKEGIGGEEYICIHAGGSKEPRRWHMERFCEVARYFATRRLPVLALGAGEERELVRELGERAGAVPCLDLDIHALAGIIERAKILICNDSGPMHLAIAVGTPVVAIFGSSSPHVTGPHPHLSGYEYEVLWAGFPCSPCRERFFRDCQPLEGIIEASQRLLERAGERCE